MGNYTEVVLYVSLLEVEDVDDQDDGDRAIMAWLAKPMPWGDPAPTPTGGTRLFGAVLTGRYKLISAEDIVAWLNTAPAWYWREVAAIISDEGRNDIVLWSPSPK